MKSKLIALTLFAGASAFAETRFSVQIGGYGPGYYAPPPVYYAPARPHVYRSYGPGWGGAGYWGEDPDRQHRRAEWYGLHSRELWEHQAQERWQLRREQWHERNGDYDAAEGPAHGSARDGMHRH